MTGGPAPSRLLGWSAEAAAASPDAIAVRYRDTALTYRELDERSDRVAAGLTRAGVGSRPVGLAMPRRPELIVGLLGIVKTGAAYLPLDADYPAARREFMLSDAGVRTVLTCRTDGSGQYHEPSAGTLLVEELIQEAPADGPAAREADPLYVIYTSGSTGTPKGVAMSHGAFGALIDWHRTADGPLTGDTTLQFAPISFDVSVQEIFSTLCNGGTLLLIDEDQRHDAGGLLRMLDDERVERFFVPTALLPVLAGAAAAQPPPATLRTVVVLGDQLRLTPAIRDWFARMPDCRLFNHYGPTETHVVTVHELTGPPAAWPDLPPIGPPLPHVVARVLDEHGTAVPAGEPGELYLGGPGLADGYLGRPDLTAERFGTDPTGSGRLYRTGDRVRVTERGELDFLGRTDRQVKIRGYRVELGEVEAALAQHPEVAQCAVLTDEDATGQRRLVAYVEFRDRQDGDAVARLLEPRWHGFLAERLPDYMVPRSFVRLAEMPLSPNGKIDRTALPLVSNDRPPLATALVQPASATEHAIAEIWREALRLREIGVLDNFFELGGNSLLVTYVHSAIARTLDVALPAVALFESPTIRLLATRVGAEDHDGRVKPATRPSSRRGPRRSGAQLRRNARQRGNEKV